MDDVMMMPGQVMAVGMVRPRAGALPGPGGQFAPGDLEVVISLQMGCVRTGGLVGADGKHVGHMVPIGEVARPLAEVQADAAARFRASAAREEAAEAARQ